MAPAKATPAKARAERGVSSNGSAMVAAAVLSLRPERAGLAAGSTLAPASSAGDSIGGQLRCGSRCHFSPGLEGVSVVGRDSERHDALCDFDAIGVTIANLCQETRSSHFELAIGEHQEKALRSRDLADVERHHAGAEAQLGPRVRSFGWHSRDRR